LTVTQAAQTAITSVGTLTGLAITGNVTLGVNDTGVDLTCYGATDGAYMKWNEATDDLQLVGAAGLDIAGDIDVDGTANLDAVDIDGTVQIDGTVTVGADTDGYDVKFFGNTTGSYLLYDESEDDLVIVGGKLGVNTATPDQLLTVAGNLGGYGLHVDSSTGAGIEIDRGASTNAHSLLFQTDGVDDWAITNYNDGDALCIKDGGYTGTEIARFTPTGLGIGTTSPSDKLHVADAVTTVSGTQIWAEGRYGGYGAGISFASATSDGGTLKEMAKITGDGENSWNTTASTQDAGLRFFTCLDGTLAETMRISATGLVYIGDNPSSQPGTDGYLNVESPGTTPGVSIFNNTASATAASLVCRSDVGGAETLIALIETNGDFQSATDSYGATSSDERLKTTEPCRDYLNDLLALDVVNFQFTKRFVPTQVPVLDADGDPVLDEDGEAVTQDHETEGEIVDRDPADYSIKQLGLVAQQVEPHIPGLVKTDDYGMKTLKTSILIPMLLQSVQTLTARIAALEAA